MLFSCNSDMESINTLEEKEILPMDIALDVEMIYSDSGIVKFILKSPKICTYENEEDPYMEFPEGFKMNGYDTLMNITSSISADYAINYKIRKFMEAKRNVVVINENGNRLETEHLIWDQRTRKIFTDQFVKVQSKKSVMFSDGFEADENFKKYTFKHPHNGKITIEEEDDDSTKTAK